MTTMSSLRTGHAPPHAERAAVSRTGVDAPACDSAIIFLVGILMTLGAVMVYSASTTVQGGTRELERWWSGPLRQMVFALAGFAAMLFAAHLPYRLLKWEQPGDGWWTGGLLLIACFLLLLMLTPGVGVTALGAQRSIVLLRSPFALSFQPTEVAKVVLPIWLAALLTRPGVEMRSFAGGFLPAMASAGALIGLTAVEDYGTAALMGVVLLVMLYAGGARVTHLLGAGLLGAAGGVGFLLLKEYRVQRLLTFFSQAPDPSAEGYQVTQSLIAIGSGGWFGRGLGGGVQKFGYLPQDNNDFIFAIVCEELGVAGGIAVVLVFLLLLARGAAVARRAPDAFGRLLAIGITLTICLQAAFNIAVVTNCIPTKGISLPFVSAGGSGAVFLGTAAGLLASIGGAALARRPRGLE